MGEQQQAAPAAMPQADSPMSRAAAAHASAQAAQAAVAAQHQPHQPQQQAQVQYDYYGQAQNGGVDDSVSAGNPYALPHMGSNPDWQENYQAPVDPYAYAGGYAYHQQQQQQQQPLPQSQQPPHHDVQSIWPQQ